MYAWVPTLPTPRIGLQRGPVGVHLFAEEVLDLVGVDAAGSGQVPRRYQDRQPADDPVSAVDDLAELAQRLMLRH